MFQPIHLSTLGQIAIEAGKEILDIYNHADFSEIVDFKADNSPLTSADKASHRLIMDQLTDKYPNIPVISEEGKDIDYQTRKDWEYFWLVDPLDGTKEFIKKNGQFTVNIALIHHHEPVAGVIYTPVSEELYLAAKAGYAEDMKAGAYKQKLPANPQPLQVNNKKEGLIAVRSSSHASDEEEDLLAKYGVTESISRGSSLKFCMVAEGKADIYYRHGPTMEWDTAAGQVVVECAGGKVLKETGPEPFSYNKEILRNGSFLVLSAIDPV
jgi:3'(2'), 5'-bisphosphate nucleotidase